jgi:hypothetical protein
VGLEEPTAVTNSRIYERELKIKFKEERGRGTERETENFKIKK